jgi:hypothetical protein
MSKFEKPFSTTLYLGDVIQVGYSLPDTPEVRWSEPGVVRRVVNGNTLYIAQIIEGDRKTFLTTFGTAYGITRPVKGAKRWTPLEMASTIIETHWDAGMGTVEELQYAVNALLRSLNKTNRESPWKYTNE